MAALLSDAFATRRPRSSQPSGSDPDLASELDEGLARIAGRFERTGSRTQDARVIVDDHAVAAAPGVARGLEVAVSSEPDGRHPAEVEVAPGAGQRTRR